MEVALQAIGLVILAFVISIPCGYIRQNYSKYSFMWFLLIHLPIPFIVLLRVKAGLNWHFIPFTLAGSIAGVDLVYNEFVSVLKQVPTVKSILPLRMKDIETKSTLPTGEFLIEPSISEVFEVLLPHYLENQVRDAVLQAEASEQSARMVAMRNATDNAISFMDDLTLLYNKARQEKITYEISDMVTARLATE